MKKLLLLLPLVLLLAGCSNDYQRIYDLENDVNIIEGRINKIEANVVSLQGGQKVLDEKINAVDGQTTKIFGIYDKTGSNNICVGIRDITVATYQAKDLFECIGENNGYCTCIEKYASCSIELSDIPEGARYDFNPDCSNQ